MDPSEVRARLLDDHQHLREQLHALQHKALAARDPGGAADALRTGLQSFLPALEAHMDLEDEVLVPALLEADAFGDVRTELLEDHHDRYRKSIARLRGQLEAPDTTPRMLRAMVVGLSHELQREMAEEELRLLHPDILRDDLVVSGLGG